MRRVLTAVLAAGMLSSSFAASAVGAVKPPAPTITSPTARAHEHGVFDAIATSSADRVEFSLSKNLSINIVASADVVDGTATGEVPTWGYAGRLNLAARACNGQACGDWSSAVPISVANTRLVFTSPATTIRIGPEDSTVLEVSGEGDGGELRLLRDKHLIARSTTGTVTKTVDFATMPDGRYHFTMIRCASSAHDAPCSDQAKADDVIVLRSVTPGVEIEHPRISADGDGFSDQIEAVVTLRPAWQPLADETAHWSLLDPSGEELLSGQVKVDRSRTVGLTIDPFIRLGGVALPEGRDQLVIDVTATFNGQTVVGEAEHVVISDLTGPVISAAKRSDGLIYPVHDRYRDTVTTTAETEPAEGVLVEVIDENGHPIDQLKDDFGGRLVKSWRLTWNGRNDEGIVAPEGDYRFRWTAYDNAHNASTPVLTAPVTLSHKRLVWKTWSHTFSAKETLLRDISGHCSSVSSPARRAWKDSLVYTSNARCDGTTPQSRLAGAIHRITLPTTIDVGRGVGYGYPKLEAFGAASDSASDRAGLFWLRSDLKVSRVGKTLKSNARWYRALRPPDRFVDDRGRIAWIVATTDAMSYDVKSFRVTTRYRVLA